MIVKTFNLTVTGSEVCPFADVEAQTGSDPFYPSKYVAVCAANAITTGKTASTFDPGSNITRQQVITMVVRAADHLSAGTLAPAPLDFMGVLQAGYADPIHGANLKRAEYNGLTDHIIFLPPFASWPQANATRGQVAQILWNLYGKLHALADSTTTTTAQSNAPTLVSPADGSSFSVYPRTVTLTWEPWPCAVAYVVEVQYLSPATNTWYPYYDERVIATTFTFDFVGAQPGRWRVTAVMVDETTTAPSAWWNFSFTM